MNFSDATSCATSAIAAIPGMSAGEESDGVSVGSSGKLDPKVSDAVDRCISEGALLKAGSQATSAETMTEANAVKGLMNNLTILSDPKTGTIDANALMRAAQGDFGEGVTAAPEQKAQMTKSAQYFLDRPDKFRKLETADGRRLGDKALATSDGNITAGDLAAEMSELSHPTKQQPVTEAKALEGLAQNFDSIADPATGYIDTNGLMRAAQGKFHTPPATPARAKEAQQAAQYFLSHPEAFKALKTAAGHGLHDKRRATEDGRVSEADLSSRAAVLGRHKHGHGHGRGHGHGHGKVQKAQVHALRAPPMTEADATQALLDNFKTLQSPTKHLIDRDGLMRAAQGELGGSMPPAQAERMKKAAQYFLDHPDRLKSLETAHGRAIPVKGMATPDGLISAGDMQARLKEMLQKTSTGFMTKADAVNGLIENLGLVADPKTGMIDADSLMRAAQGDFKGDATPEQKERAKQSAQYFLSHPKDFKELDTADGRRLHDPSTSTPDRKISAGDLAAEVSELAHHAAK